jgi:hypothetical protein
MRRLVTKCALALVVLGLCGCAVGVRGFDDEGTSGGATTDGSETPPSIVRPGSPGIEPVRHSFTVTADPPCAFAPAKHGDEDLATGRTPCRIQALSEGR